MKRSKRSSGCGDIAFCSDCDRSSGTEVCVRCEPSKYFRNGKCLNFTECGEGYFGSDVTNECEECPATCRLCFTYNNCKVCRDGYSLYGGSCYATCPDKTFRSRDGSVCKACFHSCSKCTGPGSDACFKCLPEYYLYGQKCVPDCPNVDGVRKDEAKRSCQYFLESGTVPDRLENISTTSYVGIPPTVADGAPIASIVALLVLLLSFVLCSGVACYLRFCGCAATEFPHLSRRYRQIPVNEQIDLQEFEH